MEHLVVRLDDPQAPASWQVVDAHGAPMPLNGEGALQDAAALSENRRVVLLLPTSEVFRSRMELPRRGRRAAARGARYALEDRIAGDVEELHFATGAIAGDHLEVAAIARSRLSEWLSLSRQAGLNPDAAYAQGDALPALPNAAVALLEPDLLLLRDGGGELASAEPAELAALVDMLCAEHAGEDAVPFRLVVFCDPALEEAAREAIAGLGTRDVELRLLEQGVIAHMAAEAMSSRAVNLLQGEFRSRTPTSHWTRYGLLGAAASALLYPALLGLQGWQAQARHDAVAQAVDDRLARLMPDVSESENLRREWRVRSAVTDVNAAVRGDPFLRLMEELERSAGENMQVQLLNFSGQSASVRVRAADMDTLENARRLLRGAGYSVVIQTATPESNGVVAAELDIGDETAR